MAVRLVGCAGTTAKTLDALEKDDAFDEELNDEIFEEELATKEEELFAEEDKLLRGSDELLMGATVALLDIVEELATAPVLTVTLDVLMLVTELEARDALLDAISELELFLEELLDGLEEVGAGFNPVLLAAAALLPPPPPPHAVKITDNVKAEAIPPTRADKVFIAFLCCCRSGIELIKLLFFFEF